MSVRATATVYLKSKSVAGVRQDEDELMFGTAVQRWLDAAPWFNTLVTTPEVHKKLSGGVIRVKQVDPEGIIHLTVFTPV